MDSPLLSESEFLGAGPGNLLFKFLGDSAAASLQAFSTDLNHTAALRRTADLALSDSCLKTLIKFPCVWH